MHINHVYIINRMYGVQDNWVTYSFNGKNEKYCFRKYHLIIFVLCVATIKNK